MQRVEKRVELTGTGMWADPDKIRELEKERERKERANAPKPKKIFKKVLREKSLESRS